MDERLQDRRNVHGRLNASWKICSLAVKGQSFLVIDGYLLNTFQTPVPKGKYISKITGIMDYQAVRLKKGLRKDMKEKELR